jgi:hypothetical protein
VIPTGVRLLGDFAGGRKGFQSANVTLSPRGSTLLVPSSYRGTLLTLNAISTVQGIEIYYPEQKTSGTPDSYGWSVFAGNTAHASSVLDVCLVNAYDGIFVSAGGHRIDNVWGWCINQGISLGRCPDITMITNCEFNPNSWFAGAGMLDWHNRNGRPYRVDGAEAFMFVNCFCYGGLVGCTFEDLDGDDILSGGQWIGGGFDTVGVGFLVYSGIGMIGCKIVGTDIAPTDSGVKCDDHSVVSDEAHKPRIMMFGVSVHYAPTYGRALWIRPQSKAKVIWSGGFVIDYTLEAILNESRNAVVRMNAVESVGAAPRITNSGGGDISDTAPIT